MSFPKKKKPTGLTGGKPRIPARGSKLASKAWLRSIPMSPSHGSGNLQKRLWRVTSDFVRIRDWYTYKTCVATGRPIAHWTEGQAGHFIAYSKCNGMFKFSPKNIHLQSAQSNSWGDYDDWIYYEEQLKQRGILVDDLRRENRDTELKINDTMVIERIQEVLKEMADLPEKPNYYQRAVDKIESYKVLVV